MTNIVIMVLWDVMLYSLVGTNVSEEPTASIFRVEEWWEGGPGPDLSATQQEPVALIKGAVSMGKEDCITSHPT